MVLCVADGAAGVVAWTLEPPGTAKGTDDAALGIDSWWEWVPTDANVSDLPSREPSTWNEKARGIMAKLRARMAAQGFGRRELRLPSATQLENPSEMLRGAQALAADVAAGKQF